MKLLSARTRTFVSCNMMEFFGGQRQTVTARSLYSDTVYTPIQRRTSELLWNLELSVLITDRDDPLLFSKESVTF